MEKWKQFSIQSPMVITVADGMASDALEEALRLAGLRTGSRFVGGARVLGLPPEPDVYEVVAYQA